MPTDQVAEIKDKIDIIDLVSTYIPLKKAGKNYKALCPFHSEKTPSFMVSPELQIYKCFGCSKAGDVYSFLQEIEGYDFSESLQVLAEKAGVKLKKLRIDEAQEKKDKIFGINQIAGDFYSYILTSHRIGKKALNYLKKRGINEESIAEFGLGYSPKSWEALGKFLASKKFIISDIVASGLAVPKERGKGYYDRFRGRIMFPFKSPTGKVLGFAGRVLDPDGKGLPAGRQEAKYVNTPETLIFNKSSLLYGFDIAKKHIKSEKSAILVEGQTDVISAHQEGFKNVVASGGTSLTNPQVRLLKRFTDDLIISYDADQAGIQASKRGIDLATGAGLNVKVMLIPEGFNDVDEVVRKGPNKLKQLIENAENIYDFYFRKVFSEFNPADPIGKKKISKVLLPILKEITDSVEKAHYIRKLSVELDVPEDSLITSMEKLDDKSVEEVSLRAPGDTLSDRIVSAPEEYMISLLLKSPLNIAKKGVRKLAQKDFTNKDLSEIFSMLKSYIIKRKKAFDIKGFYAKLRDSLRQRVESLYLLDLSFDKLGLYEDQIENLISEETENTIKILKKETVKRELKELGRKIKLAESEGKKAELNKLKKEFSELSKKLM